MTWVIRMYRPTQQKWGSDNLSICHQSSFALKSTIYLSLAQLITSQTGEFLGVDLALDFR